MNSPRNERLVSHKVAFLGEAAVGKSSIVLRFVKDHFSPYTESTVGASFFTKLVNISNESIKLDIWDTAGQERYHSLAPMYYRSAHAIVIVYDITDLDSYEMAKVWLKELKLNVKNYGEKSQYPIIYLIGNKADLNDKERKVNTDMAYKYAAHHGLYFREVSAKEGTGIIDLFHDMGYKLQQIEKKTDNNPEFDKPLIILEENDNDDDNKRWRCCWK